MSRKKLSQDHSEFPAGLSAPARRALAGAGISSLEQLAKWNELDFAKLHGIGPKAVKLLKRAMAERGLSFAKVHRE